MEATEEHIRGKVASEQVAMESVQPRPESGPTMTEEGEPLPTTPSSKSGLVLPEKVIRYGGFSFSSSVVPCVDESDVPLISNILDHAFRLTFDDPVFAPLSKVRAPFWRNVFPNQGVLIAQFDYRWKSKHVTFSGCAFTDNRILSLAIRYVAERHPKRGRQMVGYG